MSRLLLNGRFLTRSATGVDRVACELVAALLDRGLPDRFSALATVTPRGDLVGEHERPRQIMDTVTPTGGRARGHLWEQFTLARACADDWLLSLCNTGPIMRRRQVVMIHDAQVFTQPQSYARSFKLFYHALLPRLARTAALVLTVSEHSKSELERLKVVPEGKTRVVPNGADHILRAAPEADVLATHGLRPHAYILAIGSLAPHKNLKMAVAAANARQDKTQPLVIAGGSNAAVFGEAGIEASAAVKLIGRVSDGELRALYEHASALVFPSLTEGFGLPAIEAMMCGCPVIASTGGAIPEVCGDAALLLDPHNRDGWTAAMEEICTDAARRDRLRNAGEARAKGFSWANAANILVQHLQTLPANR